VRHVPFHYGLLGLLDVVSARCSPDALHLNEIGQAAAARMSSSRLQLLVEMVFEFPSSNMGRSFPPNSRAAGSGSAQLQLETLRSCKCE